jgi:hypothetical protein
VGKLAAAKIPEPFITPNKKNLADHIELRGFKKFQ